MAPGHMQQAFPSENKKDRSKSFGLFDWGDSLLTDVRSEPAGARTQDPVIKSHMLYQLSYRPVFNTEERVK